MISEGSKVKSNFSNLLTGALAQKKSPVDKSQKAIAKF